MGEIIPSVFQHPTRSITSSQCVEVAFVESAGLYRGPFATSPHANVDGAIDLLYIDALRNRLLQGRVLR